MIKKYIILLFPFLLSCTGIGQGGTYNEFKGKAVITKIEKTGNTSPNCPETVNIFLNFTPDNPNDIKNYRFDYLKDQNAKEFYEPSIKWIERKGIKVGDTFNATRFEIVTGTSTPAYIQITDDKFIPLKSKAFDICS